MAWAPRKGELIAERFLLEEELARGGMGSIWVAHHVTLDSPCAVKFIDERYASVDRLRKRFEGEARAAAKLRSRHVVQILDYGVWHGSPYIAMELLEGETLAERLERDARLDAMATLRVLKGVVRALSKARLLGIVHRDLKPENIFLVSEGEGDYPKVLDFGIAKLRDPNRLGEDGKTKTGAVLGTPFYMSPEQTDGTIELDHRSDLWALAVIAFECLTGEVPFYSEAFGNLVSKILHGPIPLPSDYAPDLPEAVDEWWLRASQRDREKRFQTAGELFEELEAALLGEEDVGIARDRPSRVSWLTPGAARRRMSSGLGASDPALASTRPPMSSAPPPSDPSGAWMRVSQPAAPRGRLGSGDFVHAWSTPSESAQPSTSDAPLDTARPGDTPAHGVVPPAPPVVETFAGQASSHPGPLGASRRWAFVAGAAAALLLAAGLWWAVGGEPDATSPTAASASSPPLLVPPEPARASEPSATAMTTAEPSATASTTAKPSAAPSMPAPPPPRLTGKLPLPPPPPPAASTPARPETGY